MIPRHVRPIERDALERLTTQRLLAFRKRLLSLEDFVEDSDWSPEEVDKLDPIFLYFKEDPRWQSLYTVVQEVLSTRENV